METERLRRDLAASVRLPFTSERPLWARALLAVFAYVLWIGLSGGVAASTALLPGRSLAVDPWTTTTTLVVSVVTLLWVIGPAALWTYVLVGELTNTNGHLAHYYRVQYPLVLVAVPLAAFGLLGTVGIALGRFPLALLGALVVVGTFVLVRTLVYSYRVFSLPAPRALQAFVVESTCVLAVAVLAGLADLAGRQRLVVDVAGGLDATLGTTGITALVSGTVTLRGMALPALPALAAGFPVVLALSYVVVQTLVGLVARIRVRSVPRSNLRTGQRYPAFAHPNADGSDHRQTSVRPSSSVSGSVSPSGPRRSAETDGDGTAGTNPPGGDDTAEESAASSGELDQTSHTRVFSPPDDADLDAVIPAEANPDGVDAESDGADSSESEDGYECPACGESFSGADAFAYCPTCGTELQPK